jgi:hypothetical protein
LKKYRSPVGERLSGISTFRSLFGAQLIFVGFRDGVSAIIFVATYYPNSPKRDSQLTYQNIRIHRNFRESLFHKRRLPKGFAPLILCALFVGP